MRAIGRSRRGLPIDLVLQQGSWRSRRTAGAPQQAARLRRTACAGLTGPDLREGTRGFRTAYALRAKRVGNSSGVPALELKRGGTGYPTSLTGQWRPGDPTLEAKSIVAVWELWHGSAQLRSSRDQEAHRPRAMRATDVSSSNAAQSRQRDERLTTCETRDAGAPMNLGWLRASLSRLAA